MQLREGDVAAASSLLSGSCVKVAWGLCGGGVRAALALVATV